MMYPLVRELAARDAPIRVPVAVSCRVLNFSRQAYYQWVANPVPARDWEEAHLINAAVDHHHDDPAFGYRFIAEYWLLWAPSAVRVSTTVQVRDSLCSAPLPVWLSTT